MRIDPKGFKGLVFEGLPKSYQTFRFIRHAPFRYYLDDKFSLKTFIYWFLCLLFVYFPRSKNDVLFFLFLFGLVADWPFVIPKENIVFFELICFWIWRYSQRRHSFVNNFFCLQKLCRNVWISRINNWSSLQKYNWHRHETISHPLLPFILRSVFRHIILLERKKHVESVQGESNPFKLSSCLS